MITLEKFKQLFPSNKNPQDWVTAINTICPRYNITHGPRLWMFLAQCGHESNSFTIVSENLNYSREGLLKVFPKYFDVKNVDQYARKPIAIASRCYANRIGNGDETSQDGWKYRGRGPIQTTGKANYEAFSKFYFTDDTAVKNPDILLEPMVGIAAACFFWTKNNLNEISDREDVTRATKVINGGSHGLEDRKTRFANAKRILA